MAEINPDTFCHMVEDLVEGNEYCFCISSQNSVGLSTPLMIDHPVLPLRAIGKWFNEFHRELCMHLCVIFHINFSFGF